MKKLFLRTVLLIILLLIIIIAGFMLLGPSIVEKRENKTLTHAPYIISPEAQALHNALIIGDLHNDSTLWNRNLLERSHYGHSDIPRLQSGNIALQVFTSVTKSPKGQNYHHNLEDAFDNITLLAMAQAWPIKTWRNLTERALYQASRLRKIADKAPEKLTLITHKRALEHLLQHRKQERKIIGAILGIEGAHALEGKVSNIDVLYKAGFRVVGLQHFFDNKIGGSLHGEKNTGLTPFGHTVVDQLIDKKMIIDVAHSSPEVVNDMIQKNIPLIISHTGFYGHCAKARNISDALMLSIAKTGGLIGVGYWDGVLCDTSPKGIVAAIRYGIDLVGVDHIALGSDFDGAITTQLDASELAAVTQEMLNSGFSKHVIRKVMGENMVQFFLKHLPEA